MSAPAAPVYDELDSFEHEYQPRLGLKPSVESLPAGTAFDFEILKAELKKPKDKLLAEAVLRCLTAPFAGQEFQHTWWLDKPDRVNFFCGDLLKLGFDSDKWGEANKRPLKAEIPAAVLRLPGRRFRGGNRKSTKDNKEYVNFNVDVALPSGGTVAPPPPPGNAKPPVDEDLPFSVAPLLPLVALAGGLLGPLLA
jgi:hypothetical protein